jgi:hypothetical protein
MFEAVEKWRIAAAEWLDLQEAADMLRETKNDVLAEIISGIDGKSYAERERLARTSHDWKAHVKKIIEAEAKARRSKMRVKYADMVWNSERTESANARSEKGKYQ